MALVRTLSLLMLGAAVLWTGGAAKAVSLSVAERGADRPGSDGPALATTLRLSGPIEEGDPKRLRALLEQLTRLEAGERRRGSLVADLDSPGGDLYAALEIGYLFREYDVATLVHAGGSCREACAMAFLGGTASHLPHGAVPDRRIEIGGDVAFLSFAVTLDSPLQGLGPDVRVGLVEGFNRARGDSSLLVRYAAAMAIDPVFIARLIGRPAGSWEPIDRASVFEDLASCPLGLERPRLPPAAIAANICNHATGGLQHLDAGHARETPARAMRQRLLARLRDGVDSLSLAGALTRQLHDAATAREDRRADMLYEDLRATGVPLLATAGTVFEVTGYATGSYEMQCDVSFAPDDPDRYDVTIASAGGLTHAFKTAPRQCPRLFLYDRDEVLNPARTGPVPPAVRTP